MSCLCIGNLDSSLCYISSRNGVLSLNHLIDRAVSIA